MSYLLKPAAAELVDAEWVSNEWLDDVDEAPSEEVTLLVFGPVVETDCDHTHVDAIFEPVVLSWN